MTEKEKYIFDQYVYGRFSWGYDAKSTQGSHVPSWLQNTTRETKVSRELPTLEMQSNPDSEKTDITFSLCNSVYVDNAENKNESGTRNFAFSQSLLLVNPAEATSFRKCAADMLEILACGDCFWTSQTIHDWGEEALPAIEIEAETIRKEWIQLSARLSRPEMTLSQDNLALFLARYWEVCSQRTKHGKPDAPILLVITSPENSYATAGKAIIPEGVRFFVEEVLPHMPEEVLPILSVSFGCLGAQVNAQQGTACMVCYPTSDTLEESQLSVYLTYEDAVYDDKVTSTVLEIGQMMLSGNLPSYYRRLSELDESKKLVRDFDLFYAEVSLEEILDAGDKWENVSEEDQLLDMEAIEKQRQDIIETLQSDLYSESEITYILFELERKFLASCEQLKGYNKNLYKDWLASYLSLEARASMLSLQETDELRKRYHHLLIRQNHWQAVEQIIEYCTEEKMDSSARVAPTALAKEILLSLEKNKKQPRNVDEAIEAWDNRLYMVERLRNNLEIPESSITQLLSENELRILQWYPKSGLEYNDQLFERILRGAESLELRTESNEKIAVDLQEAYSDCLTYRYAGMSKNASPLLTIMALYPKTEDYPNSLMQYEEGICQTATFMDEPPCATTDLMERMLGHQMRAGEKASGIAHMYQELISHFVPDGTEQLRSWVTIGEKNIDHEKAWKWLAQDLLYFLKKQPEDQPLGTLLEPVLDQYEKLRSVSDQEILKEVVTSYACQELQDCLHKGKEIDKIVQLIWRASLPMDENSAFYQLLMNEVQEEGLDAFTNTNLMEGISLFHSAMGRKANNSAMGDVFISCAQKKHEQDGLDFKDLSIMLHICDDLSIDSSLQKKVYATVFDDCKGNEMPKETEDAFRTFLSKTPLKNENIEDDPLIKSMIEWAKADPDKVSKNLMQLLSVADGYLVKYRSTRTQLGVSALKAYISVLPSWKLPSNELVRKILDMMGNREIVIEECEMLCSFYNMHSEDENLYDQMWEVAERLGFQPDKIDQNKPIWIAANTKQKWVRCFLSKTTAFLNGTILKKTPDELLGQDQKPDGIFRTWNVLYSLAEDEESIPTKEERLKSVTDSCRQSFKRTGEKTEKIVLPLARKMKDAAHQNSEVGFHIAFLSAFKEYLRAIMEDDQLFRETVNNKDDLQSVKYCWDNGFFEPLTEDIRKRGEAMRTAFELIELYDSRDTNTLLKKVTELLVKIKHAQPAFEAMQDICFKLCTDKTSEWAYPEKDLPQLVHCCQQTSTDSILRFDWMQFLNEAHPRPKGKEWVSADILNDDDNTYGTVASLMNWFASEEEAKPILESFQRFLDQSNIGKKVRAKRRSISRFYDSRTNNPMIHWILGIHIAEGKQKQ